MLNAAKGHNEQIGRLVRMFANHREEISQIEAGMIGVTVFGLFMLTQVVRFVPEHYIRMTQQVLDLIHRGLRAGS